MIYSFQDESGQVVELMMPMAEAVPIGATIQRGGQKYRRLAEREQQARTRPNVNFTDVQLAPWTPHGPRYDAEGQIQFQSRREVEEFTKKLNDLGDPIGHDT